MRIESATLSGFRCFGPEAITVPIAAEITAVVGPNAAGKTALLYALATMFGVTRAKRTVQRTDFHMGTDDDPDDREAKNLFIDVLIGLPELDDGTATPETIAPSFRHMQIEREGKTPVCRMRLEARWEDDGTIDGEVSQDLFWVDTLDDNPPEDKCHPVSASDRGLIQLYYTPAIFEQGPDGHERGLDALSDGQQSLFYFALAAAVFDLERKVVAGDVEGFLDDQLRIPALTLFALEESENPVLQGVWVRFPPPAPFKMQQLFKKRDRGNGTQSRTFLLRHDLIDRQFNNS